MADPTPIQPDDDRASGETAEHPQNAQQQSDLPPDAPLQGGLAQDAPSPNKQTHNDSRQQNLALGSATAKTATTAHIQNDNLEVKARVQHLVSLIKDQLRSRTLSPKTQKELARLLSLLPKLNGRHLQQLNLLDLAVSTLLESDSPPDANSPNNRNPNINKPDTNTNTSKSQQRKNKQAEARNLVFVQETRRQITQQSRPYPNILRSIFITGGGTPYIRLISGLSWFFLVFVVAPLTLVGATLLVREAARDIVDYTEAKEAAARLADINTTLEANIANQQAQISELESRQNSLLVKLGQASSQLSQLSEEGRLRSEAQQASTDTTEPTEQVILTEGSLEVVIKDIATELNPEALTPEGLNPDSLNSETTEPNAANRDLLRPSTTNSASPAASDGGTAASSRQVTTPSVSRQVMEVTTGAINAADKVVTDRFSLMLLAISMGALGSTISVIVRANTFIQQAQETENDLFLTGFFRPFVGMSFAIFCVALVEAGIFSGLFDVNRRENADRTYFYVAIAFVAGFSERLVRDVVIKTEDTLAGPARPDND